jgi:phosphoribosylamine--glycine ligase
MKVLIVGNGAREHVVAERIAEEEELYAVMSKKNPALARLSKEHWICDIENADEVKKVLEGKSFDLGFSSPDATLAAGVSDVLREFCSGVASPSKNASRIEWDKAYARNLMKDHSIPGLPSFRVVFSEEEGRSFIKETGEVAVKPVGLTGGKGVKIMGEHLNSETETIAYVNSLIEKDGSAVLEERLFGEEFTLQAFCDGEHVALMPPVQDHKRAFEGDRGPNTGGMGSYSTGKNLPFLGKKDLEEGMNIIRKTTEAMRKDGNPFRGILYGQFMATKRGAKVIEFNARFGDPEAMNVVPLVKGSFVEILQKMADGNLGNVEFDDSSTVVKYLVPEGYPGKSVKDAEVGINRDEIKKAGARVYYASVYDSDGKILTTGSRSFGILGIAENIEEAERVAEKGCNSVSGPLWHRKDIGTKELLEKRIRHMQELRGKE